MYIFQFTQNYKNGIIIKGANQTFNMQKLQKDAFNIEPSGIIRTRHEIALVNTFQLDCKVTYLHPYIKRSE